MSKEVAIKIQGVKKKYRLGQIGGGSLQADLQSWWARKRGKEDPNTKIGTDQRLIGQTFMALTGIDLTVYQGEALGIIGRNGAGKSTLLKLLSRVTAPTEGTIDIYGRITSMLEVGTGFHPEMTGRENVYMNGAILGMTKAEIDSKMDQIIEFSEVGDFIDTPVKRYSSGMYVKLAFSVAAHLDSEIMIMDEVLAVGDMKFQQKCLGKMRDESYESGKTILYVSHNMDTIRRLCSRCIVLDKGKIIYDGDVESAIAIYSDFRQKALVEYDYSKIKRSPNETRDIRFDGLSILDRQENVINQGDIIHAVMHCSCKKDINNVKFRFEIFSASETIVGTMFSNKGIDAEAGQKLDVYLDIPTKNFAPGKYECIALAYIDNEYGNQMGVDRVAPAMIMEIINSKNNAGLIWLPQYWGNVRFDDMKIEKVKSAVRL